MQQHGGNIHAFAKEVGCQESEVIDLSSNINFVKPKIDIDFNTLDISAYPNYEKLELAIATLYEVSPNELELFNGATVAIYALFRELQPQYATIYAPAYLEYEKALTLNQCKIEQINRFENLYKEVKANSLIVFVNPSTPDGKYYELDKLMQRWIAKNCTILIDESFLDFTPYTSCRQYLKSYDKLYILKSMTKFYSSAGIRIGALISNSQNIKNIKKSEPLWKISQFDSHYLQEALKEQTFKERSLLENRKSKLFLERLLEESSIIEKIYPSSANFIMVKLKEITAKAFQERLKKHKIMVRDCSNFTFLDENHLRIAIKGEESLKAFKMAITRINKYKL